VGAAVVLALLVGAGVVIASSMDHSEHGGGGSGAGNADDAAFVSGMIPHHEGAVEMAQIALNRAEHPEIKNLANEIIAAQEEEIGTMTPIKEDLEAEHGEHMSGEGHGGTEMEPEQLRTAEPFDREFIDMMIPHHQDAVEMAKEELDKGENDTLRKLAEDIISAQNREIEQMRKWREEWYGSAGTSSKDSEESGGHVDEGH
jgi:uncharacterized protein (DUF305 family)